MTSRDQLEAAIRKIERKVHWRRADLLRSAEKTDLLFPELKRIHKAPIHSPFLDLLKSKQREVQS